MVLAAGCPPPLARPTLKLLFLSLAVSGAARHGIELVCRKSSGPFLLREKERRRPGGSCLLRAGARTLPCLARRPWPAAGTSIFLLSLLLLEVTRAGGISLTLGVRDTLTSPHSLALPALQPAEWPGGAGRELRLLGVRRNLCRASPGGPGGWGHLVGESVWVWLRSLLLRMLVRVSAW